MILKGLSWELIRWFFSESDFWQTEILSGGLFHAVGFVGQHPSGVYRRMYPFRQRARVALFERTDVTFFPLTQEEIWNYIHEEKPFDKAGSYGIQGKAAVFVEKIQGDFFNVVGFPAARFIRKLRTLEK